MIPILLVDDDVILLNKVNALLEQCSRTYMVVDRVMSGADALEAVEKYKPKIIFMDVELPILNGIEATNEIMKKYPNMYIIALSNYDNFFYLRNMLQAGAKDYILKHELSKEIIEEKLTSIVNELVDCEEVLFQPSVYSPWEMQDYFRHVLFHEEDVFEHQNDTNTIFGFVLFQITNFAVYYSDRKKENLLKSILTILYNILPNESVAIEIDHGEYAVLVKLESNPSTHALQKRLAEYVELIRSNLIKLLNIHIIHYDVVLYGKQYKLAQIYREAEKKIGLVLIGEGNETETNMMHIACLNHIINYEEALFLEDFQTIFTQGKTKQIHLSVVHKNVAEMMKLIRNYLRSKEEYLSIEESYSANVEQLFRSQSVEECEQLFQQVVSQLFRDMNKLKNEHYSEYVRSALDYMETNYASDISLNMVADSIGITSVYLSNLFKKEVDITFINYLTKLRLKKSEKYIVNTRLSIKEIAKMVGYNNSSYFVSVFKTEYGCSPMKFRNQDN